MHKEDEEKEWLTDNEESQRKYQSVDKDEITNGIIQCMYFSLIPPSRFNLYMYKSLSSKGV